MCNSDVSLRSVPSRAKTFDGPHGVHCIQQQHSFQLQTAIYFHLVHYILPSAHFRVQLYEMFAMIVMCTYYRHMHAKWNVDVAACSHSHKHSQLTDRDLSVRRVCIYRATKQTWCTLSFVVCGGCREQRLEKWQIISNSFHRLFICQEVDEQVRKIWRWRVLPAVMI